MVTLFYGNFCLYSIEQNDCIFYSFMLHYLMLVSHCEFKAKAILTFEGGVYREVISS